MRYALLQRLRTLGFFAFFDKGELIVLTNSFIKKSQKTPRQEIQMAEKLKAEYMNEKYGGSIK